MKNFHHKKRFGQHFLKNNNIAQHIVQVFKEKLRTRYVLEVGPGKGVLTQYLVNQPDIELFISEIDIQLIPHIQSTFHIDPSHLIQGDFLAIDLQKYIPGEFSLIGNFPYNISTQIVFKMIENRNRIPMMTGMFQKEVAERIAARHGNKIYGITSVLTQVFYDVEYLITVDENEFTPPPKVKSAVIRLVRKPSEPAGLDADLLFKLVKAGFNQRRKTLKNSLKNILLHPERISETILNKRAEQLSVQDWIELTAFIKSKQ